MVNITLYALNSSSSVVTSYTATVVSSLTYDNEILLTSMPITGSEYPYLMNLGGAQSKINIDFDVFSTADVNTIFTYFQDATMTYHYQMDLSAWGLGTVTGLISGLDIKQVAGEPVHWSVSIVMQLGNVIV